MGGTRSHWEKVYTTKAATAVSWYQPHSERSLALIAAASPDRAASLIDVGGGASTLADDLLARGFADVTVLDIAETALQRAKARLGKNADKIAWIVADVTHWRPPRSWDIWHDRAVFHFLVDTAGQEAYVGALKAATKPGAIIIIATFALDGPQECGGLKVQRYSAETLAARLGPAFRLTSQASEDHHTPSGAQQRFTYAVLARQ